MVNILSLQIGQNSGQNILIAIGIVILTITLLKTVAVSLIAKLKTIAKKTKTDIDDIVIETIDVLGWPFYTLVALYVGGKFLTLSPVLDKIMNNAILIIVTFYVVRSIGAIVQFTVNKHIATKKNENKEHEAAVARLVGRLVSAVLYSIALLFILSNFGINITSLITGLGIGGIAIALAVQSVLSDLFASLSIYFDKPFEVGDYIVIGTDSGIVKKIGIKSTRIATLQGEELVISNAELTSARVQNFKKMQKRRVIFTFGVTYNTAVKKLKTIPDIITRIITDEPKAEIDRVHFKTFGDSSLNFEIVYYMTTKEYSEYMSTQQNINLAILKAFEKAKIEMAFPTRTIYMKKA